MKFLALRAAFEKAEKKNEKAKVDSPAVKNSGVVTEQEKQTNGGVGARPNRVDFVRDSSTIGVSGVFGLVLQKEKVAGGDIKWKPIDRLARALLRPTLEWCDYPCEKPSNKKTENKMKNYHDKEDAFVNSLESTNAIKGTRPIVDEIGTLSKQAMDAKRAIEIVHSFWSEDWPEFTKGSDQRLNDLRAYRMSFDSECRAVLSAAKDMRNFFLDKDYSSEMSRIREFIELAEKFKQIKDSGFMDAIVDIFIRLSENSKVDLRRPPTVVDHGNA